MVVVWLLKHSECNFFYFIFFILCSFNNILDMACVELHVKGMHNSKLIVRISRKPLKCPSVPVNADISRGKK